MRILEFIFCKVEKVADHVYESASVQICLRGAVPKHALTRFWYFFVKTAIQPPRGEVLALSAAVLFESGLGGFNEHPGKKFDI